MKIRIGDTIKVLYGKDSDKRGKVVAVDSKSNRIIVEGINVFKKHIKGDGKTRVSEIVSIEKALYSSKVMVVCPNCDKATRIGTKKEGKNVVRVCKKCGKSIEIKKEEKKETAKKTAKKTSTTKKTVKKETKSKKDSK